MATAAVSGKAGSVTTTSGATEITEWNCTLTSEALEATSMASAGWREFIEGLKGGSGSFTCVGVQPTVGADAALALAVAGSGTLEISGDAIISSVETSTPVDGVVEHSADYVFTGEITVGTVT